MGNKRTATKKSPDREYEDKHNEGFSDDTPHEKEEPP